MWRFILAVLVTGFLLLTSLAGREMFSYSDRCGNERERWRRSLCTRHFHLSSHAVLQFVSDFVFALVLCAVYRLASPNWEEFQNAASTPVRLLIVWLGGVPMVYLGLVNGGYLPAGISIATTALLW